MKHQTPDAPGQAAKPTVFRIALFQVKEALTVAAARCKADQARRAALALAGCDVDLVIAIHRLDQASNWNGLAFMMFNRNAMGVAA